MTHALPKYHPMFGFTASDLMPEAAEQTRIDDALLKSLVALQRARERVKSDYSKRLIANMIHDTQDMMRKVNVWEEKLTEAMQ